MYKDVAADVSREAKKYMELKNKNMQNAVSICQLNYQEVRADYALVMQATPIVQQLENKFNVIEKCRADVLVWVEKISLDDLRPEVRDDLKKKVTKELDPILENIRTFKDDMEQLGKAKNALRKIYSLYDSACGGGQPGRN